MRPETFSRIRKSNFLEFLIFIKPNPLYKTDLCDVQLNHLQHEASILLSVTLLMSYTVMAKEIKTEIVIHATPEKYGKYLPISGTIRNGILL